MTNKPYWIDGIKIRQVDYNRYYVITFDKNEGSFTGYTSKKGLEAYLNTRRAKL